MREILFRGKQIDNGVWVEGYLYITHNGEHEISIYNDEVNIERWTHEVDPSTVGQYTGLTDKNGKGIFEGDVVSQSWYDYEEPRDTSFGEVVYCEYDCSFSVMDDEKDKIVPLGSCAAYVWEVEVIGNVHDNPELLEK